MNPLTTAVLQTGLVDPALLTEMRKWGMPIEEAQSGPPPKSLEEVSERIQQALESQDYVLVRETDLEVLDRYLRSTTRGSLHILMEDGPLEKAMGFEVAFARTLLGEYIFAWMSAGISDLLTNGMTYLDEGGTRVYFREVRELFFGDTKAFMICTPYRERRVPLLLKDADGHE